MNYMFRQRRLTAQRSFFAQVYEAGQTLRHAAIGKTDCSSVHSQERIFHDKGSASEETARKLPT